jgi:hypothetical protein
MQGKSGSRSAVLQWVVVLVVGVLVVTVVLGLNLIPRLNDGQKVLDAAKPAFATERLTGARAGIDLISADVDTADPIMNPQGGAAAEVPKLIAFVSEKTGLSQGAVVAALQKNFPHTTALLQTIPLSSVTTELPGLLAFLEKTLHVSQAQLIAALKTSFPAITQAITNLPTVTTGWNNVQNIDGATRFHGTPIKTVPDVRTYFSSDVIPVVENQRGNYEKLVSTSRIDFIGPLVLIVGVVVVVYGVLMLLLARRPEPGESAAASPAIGPSPTPAT